MGFTATTPQKLPGWRMEPPVSLPSVTVARPAATAAALPPDEPPGTRARSHGLRVGPKALVLRGGAERELVHVELAERDAARIDACAATHVAV